MKKQIIKFTDKFTETVYVDTTSEVENDTIIEEYNQRHEGEENVPPITADEASSIASSFKEMEQEDFKENYKCSSNKLGLCIMQNTFDNRYHELYGNGPHIGYLVTDCSNVYNLLKGVGSNPYDYKVFCNKNGLFTKGYIHDGTNTTEIRPLTKKGIAFYERHRDEMTWDMLKKLFETKGYSSKVRHYLY